MEYVYETPSGYTTDAYYVCQFVGDDGITYEVYRTSDLAGRPTLRLKQASGLSPIGEGGGIIRPKRS